MRSATGRKLLMKDTAARFSSTLTGFLRSICAAAILLLALSFGAESVHGQCDPGDILIGFEQTPEVDRYICMKNGNYAGSRAQQLGTKFCAAKRVVAADQSAIRDLGFALDRERLETFAGVAEERKKELQHRILDAFLDQWLETTDKVLERAKSLNPWSVNKAAEMLEAKHFKNAALTAALRKIALQKDKPAMLAAYRDFVKLAKAAKEGWDTASDNSKDPENADLRLLLGGLKVIQGNQELGLAVTALEFGEDLAYLGYLSGQVEQLARLSDEKLLRLQALRNRVERHVDQMDHAKGD
jgi:hypothetical protein